MKAAITMLALVLSVGLTHASEYTCQVRWVPAGNAEVMVSGLFVKIGDRTITEITASALSDDHEDNWTIIFEEGKPLSALFVKSRTPTLATKQRSSEHFLVRPPLSMG